MRDRVGRLMVGAAFVVTALAGCGIDVELTSSGGGRVGQLATFRATVTNVSACPMRMSDPNSAFILATFIPRVVLEDTPIAPFCGIGQQAPPALSTSLTSQDASTLADAHAEVMALASQSAPTTCSAPGVYCENVANYAAVCELQLDPGASKTVTCTAPRPDSPGPLYSLVFAGADVEGVCKAGMNQGQACDTGSGAPCGSAANCGDGICTGGTNASNGCDVDSECPGGSCTRCIENNNALTGLGFACLAATNAAPAPALSPIGGAGALAGLAALAFWRLRRRG